MQRKHRNQMSVAEVKAVDSAVKSVASWKPNQIHLQDRKTDRKFTVRDIFLCIRDGSVFEAQDTGRVGMRDAAGTCIIVELPTRKLITVWYNDPSDNHFGLDYTQYRWFTDLRSFGSKFAPKE